MKVKYIVYRANISYWTPFVCNGFERQGGGSLPLCCDTHIIRIKGYGFSPFLSLRLWVVTKGISTKNIIVCHPKYIYLKTFAPLNDMVLQIFVPIKGIVFHNLSLLKVWFEWFLFSLRVRVWECFLTICTYFTECSTPWF